jgi:hypothetical protein
MVPTNVSAPISYVLSFEIGIYNSIVDIFFSRFFQWSKESPILKMPLDKRSSMTLINFIIKDVFFLL